MAIVAGLCASGTAMANDGITALGDSIGEFLSAALVVIFLVAVVVAFIALMVWLKALDAPAAKESTETP